MKEHFICTPDGMRNMEAEHYEILNGLLILHDNTGPFCTFAPGTWFSILVLPRTGTRGLAAGKAAGQFSFSPSVVPTERRRVSEPLTKRENGHE